MTTNYSPGPWRVSYERGTTQIRTAENESIMCDETYYPWVPENMADWDLIAAAPELLQALRECVMWIENTEEGEKATRMAFNAIRKAKGEQ